MHRRRPLALAAAIAGLALAAPASALADCPGAGTVPDAGNLAAVGQTTLCLVNEQRVGAGLPALTEDARLSSTSTAFSARMVGEHFFDHVAPDGSTLVQRLTSAGYITDGADWAAGENIAWGQGDLATPASIVTAWMNSAGHRANILSGDYTQIGLGVVTGSPSDATWGATYTTDFGSLGDGSSVVDRSDAGASAPASAASLKAASARRAAARRAAAKRAAAKRAAAKARKACTRARAASKHASKRTAKHTTKRVRRACSAGTRAAVRR
jgi:uncharacterized protein YkwD